MASPRVTVGIPFLNPGKLIVDAVRSVFAQTCDDWELILLDDGSTDGSIDLVRCIRDSRVRVVTDGLHLGLPARLNQLAKLARSDLLARMDADDIMHPERLERQIHFLESHRDVQVVDTGAYIIDSSRAVIGVRGIERSAPPTATEALKWGVVLHPSVMTWRSWSLAHPYDPRYVRAEDRELFIRRFRTDSYAHIGAPLMFYYVGHVRIRALLRGYKSERAVLMRYGPRLIGWPKSCLLWGRSVAKSCVVPLLAKVGRDDLITRRSCTPVSPEIAAKAESILRKIQDQEVPGW